MAKTEKGDTDDQSEPTRFDVGTTKTFAAALAKLFLAIAAIMGALPAFCSFTNLAPVSGGPMAPIMTAIVSISCYLTIALVFFYRDILGRIFAWKADSAEQPSLAYKIVHLLPALLVVTSIVSFITYARFLNRDILRLFLKPPQLDPDTMLCVFSTYIIGFVCAVGAMAVVATKEYYLAEKRREREPDRSQGPSRA